MAQVIDYYRAVASPGGNPNIYIFAKADPSSTKYRKLVKGDGVLLGLNYWETESNGMVRIRSPEAGWMYRHNLSDIQPIYKTVTDGCTPPSSVTLDTDARVLRITGGAGGDLNTLEGWGVSHRERNVGGTEWGVWSGDAVSAIAEVSVTVNAGKVRQFRVRTRGSAGSGYYSSYVECVTLLSGNTPTGTPKAELPGENATTASATPVMKINCPADSEGDALTLMRRIDNGGWTSAAGLTGAGGVVYDRLPALAGGRHTIHYKLVDANGAESAEDGTVLTVVAMRWGRAISTGAVIANAAISHQSEIKDMLKAVNQQRAFYGLPEMKLPGAIGRFADWKAQMEVMQSAIAEAYAHAGQGAPAWTAVPGCPAAAVINEIRERVTAI